MYYEIKKYKVTCDQCGIFQTFETDNDIESCLYNAGWKIGNCYDWSYMSEMRRTFCPTCKGLLP